MGLMQPGPNKLDLFPLKLKFTTYFDMYYIYFVLGISKLYFIMLHLLGLCFGEKTKESVRERESERETERVRKRVSERERVK